MTAGKLVAYSVASSVEWMVVSTVVQLAGESAVWSVVKLVVEKVGK